MSKLTVQRNASALPPQTAACMGAFDGMHRGHQALVSRAAAVASRCAIVTFSPHPAAVLAPSRAPKLIQSDTQRFRIAERLGVDTFALLPFDRTMAQRSPEAFAEEFIIGGLRPETIVVGNDFRFGAQRKGDVAMLERLLRPAGIDVCRVAPVGEHHEQKFSSTQIRAAITAGDVGKAAEILGRPHAILGAVEHGEKRGRTIGFPTANLGHEGALLPAHGVYAAVLVIWDQTSDDYGQRLPAVVNVGTKPTFTGPDAPATVEVHVLDRDLGQSLYGMQAEVSFLARIRGEQRFDGSEALQAQIRQDIASSRAFHTEANLQPIVAPRAGDHESFTTP